MYDGMRLYRGVISYSDGTSAYAIVPALTGNEVPVKLSNVVASNDVPTGTQVLLAVEDDKAYNVHIVVGGQVNTIDGGSA
jgi:hypothetical protein